MGQYAGAEQALVDAWVMDQLAQHAADLNLIADGISARIFPDLAPANTPYPFIVFQCQSPPRDIRGVGTTRVMVDTLYIVKAVAQASSYAPLAPIAKVIDTAMTSAAGGPVGDGMVLASVRQQGFQLMEVDSGTQYRHLGGEYHIQAQG